jgi:protein ImuA
LLRRSVFIDPPDDGTRLWAIDAAARCSAAAAVVADGSGLDLAATRRLQLAAEAGSALVLCARPPGELECLSAAATRWRVHCARLADENPSLNPSLNPRWIVELLRCKGVRPKSEVLRWTMEWKGAQGGLVVHAVLVDRPDPAPQSVVGIRRSA